MEQHSVEPEHVRAVKKLARDDAIRLQKEFRKPTWKPVLDKDSLAPLRVDLAPLKPYGNNPTVRIRPVSVADIDKWLAISKPWERRGYGLGRVRHTDDADLWWNAHALANDMISYMRCSPNWKVKSLEDSCQGWCKRPIGSPDMRLYSKKMWSDVEMMFQRNDGLPHASAIVTQRLQITNKDPLTAVELLAFLNLTLIRVVDDGVLSQHKFVPVTLVSIGNCNIRVIHGYIDPITNRLKLYVSPVVTMDKPDSYKTDAWKTLLGWLVATPI